VPVAVEEKETREPAATVCATGCNEMTGATSTVTAAGEVVADPALLVKTASNWVPLAATFATNEYVGAVAPGIAAKGDPPTEYSHCTLGTGDPVADAVNETVVPEGTTVEEGCATIAGAIGDGVTVSVASRVRVWPCEFLKIAANSSPDWPSAAEKE
jgi:hypothetical protein